MVETVHCVSKRKIKKINYKFIEVKNRPHKTEKSRLQKHLISSPTYAKNGIICRSTAFEVFSRNSRSSVTYKFTTLLKYSCKSLLRSSTNRESCKKKEIFFTSITWPGAFVFFHLPVTKLRQSLGRCPPALISGSES